MVLEKQHLPLTKLVHHSITRNDIENASLQRHLHPRTVFLLNQPDSDQSGRNKSASETVNMTTAMLQMHGQRLIHTIPYMCLKDTWQLYSMHLTLTKAGLFKGSVNCTVQGRCSESHLQESENTNSSQKKEQPRTEVHYCKNSICQITTQFLKACAIPSATSMELTGHFLSVFILSTLIWRKAKPHL